MRGTFPDSSRPAVRGPVHRLRIPCACGGAALYAAASGLPLHSCLPSPAKVP